MRAKAISDPFGAKSGSTSSTPSSVSNSRPPPSARCRTSTAPSPTTKLRPSGASA
jgi:hypothetical protein